MSRLVLYTKENFSDSECGDITNYIENDSNKIYYVIDAVSSCDNPRLAALATDEVIAKFIDGNTIENRFDVGALIKEIHEQLQAHELKLSV